MDKEEKYELVNSYLEDDISKFIFRERHLYNQDEDAIHITNIVRSIENYCGEVYYPGKEDILVERIRKKNVPIYIWGGGIKGEEYTIY